MSDRDSTPTAPRRSGRERKPTKQFSKGSGKKANGNNPVSELNDGPNIENHDSSDAPSDDEEVDEPDYVAPKAPTRGTRRGRGRGRGTTTTSRKRKANKDDEAVDGAKLARDAKISDDNALFNLILSPATALQDTVENFLESFDNTPEKSLADLINCILRSCGCNASVDSDQVMDTDGVVDALDEFTEGFKTETMPAYPIISKAPAFRKFRKSLAEFFTRLMVTSAETGSLYASELMPTLQAWLAPLSSSQVRSFRHTATVVSLYLETALCQIAAGVDKEIQTLSRQKEGEKGKKAARSKAREQDLEARIGEVTSRRAQLKEYLNDVFNSVFVHRSRDHDAAIRADCVHELGVWFAKHPTYFLESGFLPYLGKTLSDHSTAVRLEAVKSINSLYSKDYTAAVNHFTQTFKPRFIEMATSDVDHSVRLGVIQVLLSIENLALLEDEERDRLCLLIFAQDARVRKAVAPFVQRTWAEEVEQHLVGRTMTGNKAGKERQRAGAKCLSQQFIKWSQALDDEKARPKSQDTESDNEADSAVQDAVLREFTQDKSNYDRVGLAVDALWEHMEYIQRWNGILTLLLMDHTNEVDASESQSPPKKKRPGLRKEDSVVEQIWRLTEQEEDVLLHVLVAALRRATEDAKSRPKGEKSVDPDDEEASLDDITLALMKALPRLFIKHQTDVPKISKVLVIPQLMNIGMYLEMRMITAYEALWDDVSKQFLTHSSHDVIRHSVLAMKHMISATSLQNTNKKKLGELEEELSVALKLLVGKGGLKQLEAKTLDDDTLQGAELTVHRVSTLLSVKDLSSWLEDNDAGKGIRPLDIFSALVERAKLGHQQEDRLIEQAISILFSFILWKSHSISAVDLSSAEGHALQQAIKQQRDPIIETLTEYVVGEDSQATNKVKQAAFLTIIRLHLVFGPSTSHPDLHIELEEQAQHRLAGYVQAVIDEYADDLEEEIEEQAGPEEDSDTDMEREHGSKRKQRKNATKKSELNGQPAELSTSRLEKDYVFYSSLAPFIQAIRTETISIEHSSTILAHYGRFGDMYDQLARVLFEMLRSRWQKGDGQSVTSVVQRTMRDAFMLRINDHVDSEEPALSLSRLLASHFVIRGAHLAVLGRLPNTHLMDMHTYLIDFLVKKTGEAQDDDVQLASAASLFRALAYLVPVGTAPQESLRLKSHLENSLDKAAIDTTGAEKVWEGLRAYERKLVNAPKDKATTGKKRGKSKKSAMSGDEQMEGAFTSEDDGPELPKRQSARTRPIRGRAAKSKASDQSATSSEADSDGPPPSGRRRPQRDATPPDYDAEEPEDLPVVLGGSPSRSPPKSSPSKATGRKRAHERDETNATPLSQKKRKEPDVRPPTDDDSEDNFIGRKFKRIKR